jgi:hypothetical protein
VFTGMIRSIRALESSGRKLRVLEEEYEAASREPGDDEVRQAELESLKGLINQFKEEIVRFEAHMVKPARFG